MKRGLVRAAMARAKIRDLLVTFPGLFFTAQTATGAVACTKSLQLSLCQLP